MTKKKVQFDFDPFEKIKLKGEAKQGALREIRDFIVEQVLADVASGKSPVSGFGAFRGLSTKKPKGGGKSYKEQKRDAGLPARPNLEFNGDLMDSVRTSIINSKIRLTTLKGEQEKADGHNQHTSKARSWAERKSFPRRPFIPDEKRNETFRRGILIGINRIIKSFKDDEF